MKTIAAISTAVGEAGIGIVRLSGEDSIKIADKIFIGVNKNKLESSNNKKLTYGHIIDGDQIIDEVLIAKMEKPYTYTRENMVEIYCHGGIVPVRKILELLLNNGANLAEPGEFTKRAFLNGRLDLSQAEAVIDIINSKTEKSLEVSINQLSGGLSEKVRLLRDKVTNMLAHIEASIDFPDEDDVEDLAYEDIEKDAVEVRDEISNLLKTADRGKLLRDGISTVILGKPNVGKSSLLNSILKENRAIVTDVPGTTRDTIEEFVNIDGIPLKIKDTAGIRDTDDIVEQIGVDRAIDSINDADLIIAVFDASRELDDEDMEILDLIKDKKAIILINKIDLNKKIDKIKIKKYVGDSPIIETSLIENIGIDIVEENIKDMFYSGNVEVKSDTMVTNIRHKNQLEKSLENIESVINDVKIGVPLDCIEVDLTNCWNNLGEISGDTIGEDILDRIFSEFCIGK